MLVQWSTSLPEDATWETFDTFCQIYGLHNLADKVHFEGESNVSHSGLTQQKEGPLISLDQEPMMRRAQELINEIELGGQEGEAVGTEMSQEEELEASRNHQKNPREGRMRRKPKWLNDFVMYARS